MSYSYSTERPKIFTDDGMRMLLTIRDNIKRLDKIAGAFMASATWDGVTGESWTMLACLDYLVEIEEIKQVTERGVSSQHQIYRTIRRTA